MKVLSIGSCKKFVFVELLCDKGGGGYFQQKCGKIGLNFDYNSAKLWLKLGLTGLNSAKGGLLSSHY